MSKEKKTDSTAQTPIDSGDQIPPQQPIEFIEVTTGSELKEMVFRFADIDLTGCVHKELLLVFPKRLGGVYRSANLSGTWTALVEPDGDFYVAGLDGWVSSIQFPLLDPKTEEIHWFESGSLQAFLAEPDVDKGMLRHTGPLNVGSIDYETGFTRITWGVKVHSPELAQLDIDPIPLVLSEVGFFDVETGKLYTAGTGIVLDGPFGGTYMLCGNPQTPACKLRVSVPLVVKNGTPATVTVRRSPAPTTNINVTLGGTVTGNPPGRATISPGVVTLTPARPRATATLRVSGASRNADGRVTANGGGQSDFDRFKVL